ncbi:hypothetical protein AARAC_000001 [Aspergillus arachidicola]|uniref:Uncharacterized protein n=1 Tax=Aspergillus arachidicola TaxID=656916 RepID=A0A2G7FPP5_9EURO|nr:hypothetical protein AARAC_000001 [Aspergillus arachidicola]
MFVHRGLRFVHPLKQTTRKFSTQPSFKKFDFTQFYVVAGLAGLGITLWYYNSRSVTTHRTDSPKAFDSEDWVELRLASFEALSQNIKKLRFEFDDKNCRFRSSGCLPVTSAVLAIVKLEGHRKLSSALTHPPVMKTPRAILTSLSKFIPAA